MSFPPPITGVHVGPLDEEGHPQGIHAKLLQALVGETWRSLYTNPLQSSFARKPALFAIARKIRPNIGIRI